MKNIHVFLGILPTSSKEKQTQYEVALKNHFRSGTHLKDAFYGVMAATGNVDCDRVSLEILETIFQSPDAFEAPQFAMSEPEKGQEVAPEGYEQLAEGFLNDIGKLVLAVTRHSKWGKLSKVRILGCTNLVLPVSVAVNSQEAKPLELAPGTVCTFEYYLEGSEEKIRPVNTLITPFSI